LDIAEAYMSVGLHASAKPLLVSLVTSVEYNKVSSSTVAFNNGLVLSAVFHKLCAIIQSASVIMATVNPNCSSGDERHSVFLS
jgi:hypothetical protein